MKIINLYLFKSFCTYFFYSILLILTSDFLFNLINDFKLMKNFDFNVFFIFISNLLLIPYKIYIFLPWASYLSIILYFSILIEKSEFILIQTCYRTKFQIIFLIFKFVFLISLISSFVLEFIVPTANLYSRQVKNFSFKEKKKKCYNNFLFFEKNIFINFNKVLNANIIKGVIFYKFNKNGLLKKITYASFVVLSKYDGIILKDVKNFFFFNDFFLISNEKIVFNCNFINFNYLNNYFYENINFISFNYLFNLLKFKKYYLNENYKFSFIFWKRIFYPFNISIISLLIAVFIFNFFYFYRLEIKILFSILICFLFYLFNSCLTLFFFLNNCLPFFSLLMINLFFLFFSCGLEKFFKRY